MGESVQVLVGIMIVLLGCAHFADRGRPASARRQFYLCTPSSVVGRATLAAAEIAIGFAVLFLI